MREGNAAVPGSGRTAHSFDPPIRADGTCAECGKPRRVEGLKAVYLREAERDPFCSAPCARAWHGHPLREGTHGRMTAGA